MNKTPTTRRTGSGEDSGVLGKELRLRTDQEMERLQAELEQLREAHRAQQKNYLDLCAAIMGEGTFIECDIFEVAREHREAAARLATAEADTKRLDWLERAGSYPKMGRAMLDITASRMGNGPVCTWRDAIDKAKGEALP